MANKSVQSQSATADFYRLGSAVEPETTYLRYQMVQIELVLLTAMTAVAR